MEPHRPVRFMLLLATVACGASASLAALPSVPVITPVGLEAGGELGLYVCDAGDLDGDGRGDFAVGAPKALGSTGSCGQVWIFLAGDALDDEPDLVLNGEASGDRFGTSVEGCGDVNGDGWDDLVVGAPRNDIAGYSSGRVYIYFGGPQLDDQPDVYLDGPREGALAGYAVAGAGDVNGGGRDIVVGAPSTDNDGRALVYFGGAELDSIPDVVLDAEPNGYLGWAVSSAGDFNADGYDDVVVGCNTATRAFLFQGGPDIDGEADLIFHGDSHSDRFGYGVGAAGDMNGDGHDDVVIGDMHNSSGATYAGRVHVFFGGPDADGDSELVYTGTHERGIFGRTVGGCGDINADGYDDLIVGSPTPDSAGYGPGAAFVFFGGDLPGTAEDDTLADIIVRGEAESDRLGSQVALVRDQDGDGRDDLLIGANLFDSGELTNAGKFYLHALPNLAPIALADAAEAAAEIPTAIAVLANDHDPDGQLDPASVTVVRGTAAVDPLTGDLLYQSAAGFVGADTLSYLVADLQGAWSDTTDVVISVVDVTPPVAVATLSASPLGEQVSVSWDGVPADADSLELWRAAWLDGEGQSAYPLYDNAPGSTQPDRPGDRTAALDDPRWIRVATLPASTATHCDTVAARGVYHYELFAGDSAGNWSAPTASAPQVTSYRLGDFDTTADGMVDALDVLSLSTAYGSLAADSNFAAMIDVGPTDDTSGAGIPTTDGRVDFEDVMVVGLNHDPLADPRGTGRDVALEWRPDSPTAWTLHLQVEAAELKGLRMVMDLPEGVTASLSGGELLGQQDAPIFLQNTTDGLDASLVVLGTGLGLLGSGEVLHVEFSEPIDIELLTMDARDLDNQPLDVEAMVTTDTPSTSLAFALDQNTPNPFNPSTTIAFSLPQAGPARLAVYDIRGRLLARLVNGELPAGRHQIRWNGQDDRGHQMASGIYLYRLETGGETATRRMTLLK